MASRLSIARWSAASLRGARVSTRTSTVRCAFCRPYSSDAPAPPLLAKIKGDLKAAMKAKDTARLAVLRSVLAATLNASKTAQPVNTDAKVVALLRKTARSSEEAAAEFRGAGRADLADKEEAQVQILESYAAQSGIETLGPDELQAAVQAAVDTLAAEAEGSGGPAKAKASDVIKRLLAPGGPLDGKDFSKAEMARIVKTLTAQ